MSAVRKVSGAAGVHGSPDSGTCARLAQTDGKAARNLLKLQLFRQFYVLVVAYIYITRILVYLLRSTMPFAYAWAADAAGAHTICRS